MAVSGSRRGALRRTDGELKGWRTRVSRVPDNDESEGADLVFHAVLVALVTLSDMAVEDHSGERVPALGLACAP